MSASPFYLVLLVVLFSLGALSLENQCAKRGRRQTKIMKLKPRAQSTEGFQFIRASYPNPPSPGQFSNPTDYIGRLESDTGISFGREIESIIINFSAKIHSDHGIKATDRCLIIGVETTNKNLFSSFQELSSLTAHSGLSVIGCESQKSGSMSDDNLFGNGKIKQIASQLIDHSADIVVFDGELSPIQLRNLEDSLLNELPIGRKRVKVLDKTSVLLDIISQTSRSAESSMQAELAFLLYRLPRMTPMWSKLAKSVECKFSVGCRGPAGKNVDLDFKNMRKRISYLTKTLEDVRITRTAQRISRKSKGLPSIAIVGYTGSGSSSLLNALSSNPLSELNIAEEDTPFKTLEAVTRRVSVPKHEKLTTANTNHRAKLSASRNVCPDFLLIDTLSFIDKLPQCIMSAFKMNFDELQQADILVNVCDISNPLWQEQELSVLSLLNDMEGLNDKPLITIWNKLDRFSDSDVPRIQEEASKKHQTIAVSALSGVGFDDMLCCFNTVMVNILMTEVKGTLAYSPQNLALLSKLQQSSSFKVVEYTNEGVKLIGKIPLRFAAQFAQSVNALKTRAVKSALMQSFNF